MLQMAPSPSQKVRQEHAVMHATVLTHTQSGSKKWKLVTFCLWRCLCYISFLKNLMLQLLLITCKLVFREIQPDFHHHLQMQISMQMKMKRNIANHYLEKYPWILKKSHSRFGNQREQTLSKCLLILTSSWRAWRPQVQVHHHHPPHPPIDHFPSLLLFCLLICIFCLIFQLNIDRRGGGGHLFFYLHILSPI